MFIDRGIVVSTRKSENGLQEDLDEISCEVTCHGYIYLSHCIRIYLRKVLYGSLHRQVEDSTNASVRR